jgi:NAD(P)-dependent dehydrogenase (short-subunit alcohol dehydrogenase family)
MKLQGKTAIVTGAATGIGRAIGLAFLAEGARTAFVDVSAPALAGIGLEGSTRQTEFATIVADATRAADVTRVVDAVEQSWQAVDILVNNVGGAVGNGGMDGSEADWEATFALCLKSQFLFCRAVLPLMRLRRKGRIINIASNAGKYRSNTGVSSIAYSAAKSAVLQLTRSLAHSAGADQVTVNAIAPGSVLSDAGVAEFNAMEPRLRDRVLRETSLGYFADPMEIASIAVFLATDDSSYVTGATIVANGGWCTN